MKYSLTSFFKKILDRLNALEAVTTFPPSSHTHAISDITGLSSSLSAKGILVSGTTAKANAIIVTKSATVASGVAVFHLTDTGLSGGASLFPNGVDTDSVMPIVNDANASYQYGWAFSNSNKTLTVTCNKFTTANILSGVLGQAAANGSVVKLTVIGN